MDANWQDHPIEGYAIAARENGEDGHFRAPLISHIWGNLWMGGCVNGVRLDDDFHGVVSLYPWEKYRLGPNTRRKEIKMFDSSDGVDVLDIELASEAVVHYMRKGKTLVHCQAGLNRSGLIAAYTLMQMHVPVDEAIALLRAKRSPMVLCNRTFVEQLRELDKSVNI